MSRRTLLGVLLAAALTACQGDDGPAPLPGTVEADLVRVAARQMGRLVDRPVARGDAVAQGDLLFALDADGETAAVDEAAARLAESEARLADLRGGERPEEIAVREARLADARARLELAEAALSRQQRLRATRAASEEAVDVAQAERDRAAAAVTMRETEIAVARMPARQDAIAAAEQVAGAAQAALAEAQWRLSERRVAAPVAGRVEATYYEPGETVSAGSPVLALLPDGALKLRFFVPEPRLAALAVGQTVGFACDGCPAGLEARIDFVADRAEYTPPVIYSAESRDALVWMVEARPLGEGAAALKIGQPIDIALP